MERNSGFSFYILCRHLSARTPHTLAFGQYKHTAREESANDVLWEVVFQGNAEPVAAQPPRVF
jgi:hypothetical protein